MKTVPFLLLINLIIIFCFNNLEKKNLIKINKNIRILASDSIPTDLEPTDLKTTDLKPTDLKPTDLKPTDLEPTDLEPTDLKPTDLKPTDLKPTDLKPTDSSSDSASDSASGSNSTELDYLFLGVDNYHDNGNNELNFFAKYLIENEQYFQMIIFLTIIINENNLRILEEEEIKCINIKNSTPIYIYNCSYKYNETIQSIKVQTPKNSTDLAKFTCNNLVNQTGTTIPEEIFVITDCFIADQSNNVIINGNTSQNIPDNKESTLYLEENGSLEEIPLTFIKKEGNNYDMRLTLKKSLESNLNGKSGIVNIDGKNMNYLLSFKDSNFSNLDYDYNPTLNKAYIPKKSSGGLSAGAIVGIIIPCIAVLLAVLGLAFFLSKSSTGAVATSTIPMENMGNNTIGIGSSTYVVNK